MKYPRLERSLSPPQKFDGIIQENSGVPDTNSLLSIAYWDSDFSSWVRENPDRISERREEESRKKIATSRFTLFEKAGSGCWGDVYRAQDNATREQVAVKILNPTPLAEEQMKERNLTPFEAMKNEAGLAACSHVVPRNFEIDENGKPFIVMPFYDKFLSGNVERPLDSKNDPEFSLRLGYIRDIASGLSEMHQVRKRVHGDLKPDNIAIDNNGRLLLSDLGTSTCSSFGWSISPRDNMGCIYTRAPECFSPESHPAVQSDNYSWACIAYKLFSPTGKYPLEEEIDNSKDAGKFYEQLGENGLNRLIKAKVKKNIPRKLQKIILRNLNARPYERDYDGSYLLSKLEETIENMNSWNSIKKHARTALMYVALPAAFFSLAGYGIETHEPKELRMPPTRIHGMLYPKEKPSEQLEFESEDINDLPQPQPCMLFSGGAKYAKACTDNRNVAYLVKCHSQAQLCLGGISSAYTDNQFHDYISWKQSTGGSGPGSDPFPGAPWNIWAKSVECSLNLAKKDGKVDLEDVCAISRVGVDKVDEAKRISKSFDYSVYREAKYSSGEYVIPKNERRFIDTWLSYFHGDID